MNTTEQKKLVADLIKVNKNQMTSEEYTAISSEIIRKGGCNVLVFGCGKDSSLWIKSNENGKTVFLEHKQRWIDYALKISPNMNVFKVSYETHYSEYLKLLEVFKTDKQVLILQLPDEILKERWDVIIVDAPKGAGNGRMKSIYMASLFFEKNKSATVFVHDSQRRVESLYLKTFFENHELNKKTYTRLVQYN
jgi:uncharacterized protein (TIGR01627 family)